MNDVNYHAGDRRPIAARNLAVFQWMAERLAEAGVSANGISVAGMVAAILGGVALWGTARYGSSAWWLWLAGGLLTQLRLLANMLDGMVAIRRKIASPLGELYNEVPDRISDAAILVGVGLAAGGNALLGLCAALAAVFTAYVRAMAKAAGAPQDFGGPMAKPQRMFVVTVLAIYMGLTPLAWQPAFTIGGGSYGLAAIVLAVICVGSLLTAWRRLARAAGHLKASQP